MSVTGFFALSPDSLAAGVSRRQPPEAQATRTRERNPAALRLAPRLTLPSISRGPRRGKTRSDLRFEDVSPISRHDDRLSARRRVLRSGRPRRFGRTCPEHPLRRPGLAVCRMEILPEAEARRRRAGLQRARHGRAAQGARRLAASPGRDRYGQLATRPERRLTRGDTSSGRRY